jgi:hypothetical protein
MPTFHGLLYHATIHARQLGRALTDAWLRLLSAMALIEQPGD